MAKIFCLRCGIKFEPKRWYFTHICWNCLEILWKINQSGMMTIDIKHFNGNVPSTLENTIQKMEVI